MVKSCSFEKVLLKKYKNKISNVDGELPAYFTLQQSRAPFQIIPKALLREQSALGVLVRADQFFGGSHSDVSEGEPLQHPLMELRPLHVGAFAVAALKQLKTFLEPTGARNRGLGCVFKPFNF